MCVTDGCLSWKCCLTLLSLDHKITAGKLDLKKQNKTGVFLLNLLTTQEEQKEMKYKLAYMSFYLYISGTSGIFMQLNV